MGRPFEPGEVVPTTGFWQGVATAEAWRGRMRAANQASIEVAAHLASAMATLAAPLGAEVVFGRLPTVGLVFAPPVDQSLGHSFTAAGGRPRPPPVTLTMT